MASTLSTYLALFGLADSHAASFCTCVRELVENALDATATHSSCDGVASTAPSTVQVALQPLDDLRTRWKVTIVDDGRQSWITVFFFRRHRCPSSSTSISSKTLRTPLINSGFLFTICGQQNERWLVRKRNTM